MPNKFLDWDKQSNSKGFIDKLFELDGVRQVTIATAFLSLDGVDCLLKIVQKNCLNKEKILLFISPDFSDNNPSAVLSKLTTFATVRIMSDKPTFHAKVYYFESKSDRLLAFGSSNLTNGGMDKNIEFNKIYSPNAEEVSELASFFCFCMKNSNTVTQEWIEHYKKIEDELKKLRQNNEAVRKLMHSFSPTSDPFTDSAYDLSGFFFQFEDYEVFFEKNRRKSDAIINKRRDEVQKKLLLLHELVKVKAHNLGLFEHWDKTHITSSTRQIYTEYMVIDKIDWLGVRYLKNGLQELLRALPRDKNDIHQNIGVSKHACLQFNISSTSFSVLLFHSVPNDAVDRNYYREHFYDEGFTEKVNEQVKKLKGKGFIWYISGAAELTNYFKKFEFDNDSNLADFIKKNDRDGCYSYLSLDFMPDDPRIKEIHLIKEEIEKALEMLKPLLDIIAWKLK